MRKLRQHFRLQLGTSFPRAWAEYEIEHEEKLRRVLELARDEIIRLNPSRALEYLGSIRSEVDDQKGTPIWAEHQLLFADALAETGDLAAETEFQEALRRACNLSDRDPSLEMRVYDDFAKFLVSFEHRRSLARQHSESARELAVKRGLAEDSARLALPIVKIDLEIDEDPRIESFRFLKRAAKELGSSFQKQYAAWIHYCGEDQNRTWGMIAARKQGVASSEYFRGILNSIEEL